MATTCLVSILCGWLVLTAICQLEGRIPAAVRGRDFCSIVPRWTFFAPRPGVTDNHLLARYRGPEGALGPFREVVLAPPWSMRAALWNPEKVRQKVLTDSLHSLIALADRVQPWGFKTTLPYLVILNLLSRRPGASDYAGVQFAIAESSGLLATEGPRVLFLSELHPISRPPQPDPKSRRTLPRAPSALHRR